MADSVAVVTGGASGIGLAIATRLTQDGHIVYVVDLNAEQGQPAADKIGGHFIQADLAQRADCQRVIDTAVSNHGGVQILVNNAGYQHIDPIPDFPEDRWEHMLAVMLTAPFLLMKYAWPSMQSQRFGRIINISSVHGLVASPFKSAYITAKHGLIGLTRTAALEGGPDNITVNAICPAYVRTPLVSNQIADQARTRGIPEKDVVEKVMLENAAIKRLIEPEEIAALVAYLISDPAGVVTGVAWPIDNGWTAR